MYNPRFSSPVSKVSCLFNVQLVPPPLFLSFFSHYLSSYFPRGKLRGLSLQLSDVYSWMNKRNPAFPFPIWGTMDASSYDNCQSSHSRRIRSRVGNRIDHKFTYSVMHLSFRSLPLSLIHQYACCTSLVYIVYIKFMPYNI